jgi:hypothetical protein
MYNASWDKISIIIFEHDVHAMYNGILMMYKAGTGEQLAGVLALSL